MARTLERHRAAVGSTVEVLVENPGFGRSRQNWTVHFQGDASTGRGEPENPHSDGAWVSVLHGSGSLGL